MNHCHSLRFYRLLLRVYPREFRREYGEEMALCFRDGLRAATGNQALARLWMETLLDLFSSALKEHWQSLRRPMNPNNLPGSGRLRFVFCYPFGSAFSLLALACIVGVGMQLRTKDFSEAGYFLVMAQVTVLSLIILISGFIVDIENRCLRLVRREFKVSSLILSALGVAAMGCGIYRLQYLELTVEQLLPLILQIVICGTIWLQVVMLHEIRSVYREIQTGAPAAPKN